MNAKMLAEAGFETVDSSNSVSRPRLILDVFGADKTGKTHLGFTAPGPVGYQTFDYGEEGVVHKFVGQKSIVRKSYKRRIPDGIDKTDLGGIKTFARQVVEQFDRDFDSLLKAGARSVVWDTGTEYAEIMRLSYFGKLEKVPAQFYGAVNSHFQDVVRKANEANSNLIMIHRAKDEWADTIDGRTGEKRREPTGRKIRQGNETVGYLIQASVQTFKVPAVVDKRTGQVKEGPKFGVEIVSCRHNPDMEGLRLEGADFPTLANLIMPEVEMEAWL